MADAFSRAKHKLLDRAMRDGRLTPASRLVFYEIIQHLNRVSGDAWPSEARLAERLQIDVKTVKRALPPLHHHGYVEISRNRGRHNTYRPMFEGNKTGDKLSPVDDTATRDILSRNRGQIVPSTRDKNGPLSSLREPPQENLSKKSNTTTLQDGRAREDADGLAYRPDDGRVHLLLMEELGSDFVDALHQAEGGRPLRLLTTTRRDRPLTPLEISQARRLVDGRLYRLDKRVAE